MFLLYVLVVLLWYTPSLGFIPIDKPRYTVSRLCGCVSETCFLTDPSILTVRNATCVLDDKPAVSSKRQRLKSLFRNKRKQQQSNATYEFNYTYKEVQLPSSSTASNNNKLLTILLIHPIGVGIDSWFYNRLLQEMYNYNAERNIVVLTPDLLACGSASNPTIVETTPNDKPSSPSKLPLFNVTDWSLQIQQLMLSYEQQHSNKFIEWCIVSNGGCVPIALQVAQDFCQSRQLFQGNLTNVILSAPPRLSGLLQYPPPASKIKKSYRTLSGFAGKLFWWWALRNNGAFVQKFSEKNLAADPVNLGEEWTPTCVATATTYPNSRYSTFMFLAGALQQSCKPALDAIAKENVTVDVILGGDKRKNPARR